MDKDEIQRLGLLMDKDEIQRDLNLFEYVIERLQSPYWIKNWGTEQGPRTIKALRIIIENEQYLLDKDKENADKERKKGSLEE